MKEPSIPRVAVIRYRRPEIAASMEVSIMICVVGMVGVCRTMIRFEYKTTSIHSFIGLISFCN
jgi:hypothetical protein